MNLTRLEGDVRERGRAYGRRCMEQRGQAVTEMLRSMRTMRDALDSRGIATLHRVRANVRERMPELYADMEGIAEGAELPFEDVFDLNTRNAWPCEILLDDARSGSLGCTAVIAGNNGRPVLFKTLDDAVNAPVDNAGWQAKIDTMMADVTMAEFTCANSKRVQFYRQFPLMLAGDIGTNSDGLMIGQTSLHPGLLPLTADGLPHALLPPLLIERCSTVNEVRRLLSAIKVMAPKGYTINAVDAEGDYASFDCTSRGCFEVAPQRDVVFATNHLRHPALCAIAPEFRRPFITSGYEPNSRRRYETLERLRAESPGGDWGWWEEKLLYSPARDVFLQNGQEACERFITIWAAVLDPGAGRWRITEGLPRERQFTEFSAPAAQQEAVRAAV